MKSSEKMMLTGIVATLFLCIQTPAHAGVSVGIGIGGRWHHDHVSVGGYFPADYYYPGHYYGYYYPPVVPYSYVVETAPAGAVVDAIPVGYRQVMVNGVLYYEYNGTYYLPVAGGYEVVVPTVSVPSAPVAAVGTVTAANPGATNTQEEFTVNVPNAQGGYAAVTIKRSAGGYVGPQGEFYPEFPRVQQLRVMYGK